MDDIALGSSLNGAIVAIKADRRQVFLLKIAVLAVAFVAMAAPKTSMAAGIYKWVDSDGRTVFGDTPPPNTKNITNTPIDTPNFIDSDPCVRERLIAQNVMRRRQNGVSYESAMAAVGYGEGSAVARAIISDAYDKPKYSTLKYRQSAVDEFSDGVYRLCRKAMAEVEEIRREGGSAVGVDGYCSSVYELATTIMKGRQDGFSRQFINSAAPENSSKQIVSAIADAAYQLPIQYSVEDKAEAIKQFSQDSLERCLAGEI